MLIREKVSLQFQCRLSASDISGNTRGFAKLYDLFSSRPAEG